MSFAASLKVDELVVLHAHVETVHAQRQLIAALQTLAAAHQLKTIRAWPESLMGDPELRRVPRDGSLPMVAPFVEGADRWQCIHRGLWL